MDDFLKHLANSPRLTDIQRENMINTHGEPLLSLSFDVWEDGRVSMWNHMPHGEDFEKIRSALVAAHDHLGRFIEDGPSMCPFSPKFKSITS